MGNKSAASVLDRMHLVYGVKNDNQLGEALQVNRSTLGNWRARDSVPYTICVDLAEARGVSLDWLLTGEGLMFRGGAQRAGDGHVASQAPAQEPDLPELLSQLADTARREKAAAATQQERLAAIEKQLQELQAAVAALTRSS